MNYLKKIILNRRLIPAERSITSKFSMNASSNISSSAETISSSVDFKEIDHHNYLKSQWWDEAGPMKALHTLNNLRVPFVRDGLINTCDRLVRDNVDTPFPLNNMNILEVGCGGGILSEPLAKIGAKVIGLDASEDLITLAKEHASMNHLNNLSYVHDSIENFSVQHFEEFDAVVTSEVVEHVIEKDLFLKSCIQTLRPGGSLFITTINKTKLSLIAGIIIAENILQIAPKGIHHWDKFISPEDLSRIIDNYNCKPKLLHGMAYFPWSNNWCWTSNTSINYAVQYIKHS